jgi:hypothetical protein
MSTTTIDPVVWRTATSGRTPGRGVVVVALVLALAVLWAATHVRDLGYVQPQLQTTGWSSTSSGVRVDALLRLANPSSAHVVVVAARVLQGDGQPYPGVADIVITPTEIPPGTSATHPGYDTLDTVTQVPMSYTMVCDSVDPSDPSGHEATLVLTTTGTWPYHDSVIGQWNPVGLCPGPA